MEQDSAFDSAERKAASSSGRALLWYSIIGMLCAGLAAALFVQRRGESKSEFGALLAGTEFHSDTSDKAFVHYANATVMLLDKGWERHSMTAYTRRDAVLPADDALSVIREAAERAVLAAKFAECGFPNNIPAFETTVLVAARRIEICDFALPVDATIVMARCRLRDGDYEGATRFGQAALAMALHLMSSQTNLVSVTGMGCANRAIQILEDIADAGGSAISAESCRVARSALDERFRALQAREHSTGIFP